MKTIPEQFEEAVRDLIKENLMIGVEKRFGSFGASDYIKVELFWGDEEFQTTYLDI